MYRQITYSIHIIYIFKERAKMDEIVYYIESVGIENIKHNNIIKFKKTLII